MIDTHQVHLAVAGFFIGSQQIRGTQLIVPFALAFGSVFEPQSDAHGLVHFLDRAQHSPTAFVRIRGQRMGYHFAPGVGLDADHSSSQKCSPRYFSALSQSTVTMMPVRPSACSPRAICKAATTLHPDEMPTSSPPSRAKRRTMRYDSSVSSQILPSARVGS